jgi:hypothetical protein
MQTQTTANKTETIFGSTTVIVRFRNAPAVEQEVSVLQLDLDSCPALLKALDDEMQQICVYTGKDREWAKTLTPDSQVRIVEEGERLNKDFFSSWVSRRNQREALKERGMQERVIEKALPALLAELAKNPAALNLATSSQK